MNMPRLMQTFLLDGTLEGVRVVDCESNVKAFVIPRLRLGDIRSRPEMSWPALYFLITRDTNQAYIGESEVFYDRIKNHDQKRQWWDVVVTIFSTTNELEKSDVKYLESLAVARAQGGSFDVENRTTPAKNNIHEFKLHKLQKILDDTQLILTSLGYDILAPTDQKQEQVWYCKSKKTNAKAIFRGDQFVLLAGSRVDASISSVWAKNHPYALEQRVKILHQQSLIVEKDDTYILRENVAFRSPNTAGGFAVGRSANAWTLWKNERGRTMDEVMRKSEQ